MAYDESKDKMIKSWQHKGGLYLSIYQYNGGEPKIQIGPRAYKKSDGSTGYGKAGRLSLEEFGWVLGLRDEIRAEILKVKNKAA
jgi:hypothetical protein